jgi:hypothetical protein
MDMIAAWQAWVDAGTTGQKRARRRLVVQVINLLRLTRMWQSYDNAIQNFQYMTTAPKESPEAISEAVGVLVASGWDVTRVRLACR